MDIETSLSNFQIVQNSIENSQNSIIQQQKPSNLSSQPQHTHKCQNLSQTQTLKTFEDTFQEIDNSLDELFSKISKLASDIQIQKKISDQEMKVELKITLSSQESHQRQKPKFKAKNYKKDFKIFQPKQKIILKGINMSRFQLGNCIGEGKFGQVFQCFDLQTNCLYALKKIIKSTIQQYKMENQIRSEIEILYDIDHINIIKLYADFFDQYHIFILLEYVDGQTLDHYFQSEEKFVSKVLFQLLYTLRYLHSKLIIHRDIKPQNIIFSNDMIKLCDFGWSTSCKDHKPNQFVGTLDYISPEAIQKKQYNQSVDIWAIGILTYELLTGKVPFQHNSKRIHLENILNCQNFAIDYENLSVQAIDFIKKFLKKNPIDRISIQDALSHPFITKYQLMPEQYDIQQSINAQLDII